MATATKICMTRDLNRGDYFLVPGCGTGFLRDTDGRFVRLHDAAYMDGLFQLHTERTVIVVSPEVAKAAALAYRGS